MSDWELDDETLRSLGILEDIPGGLPTGAQEGSSSLGWEEPPDIADLFMHYNDVYFEHGGCRIKLSEPLLKYRPLKDLKETLLHEMIHAYNFLEGIRDRESHGPKFLSKMHDINASRVPDHQRPATGYNITTHHTMHAEVDLYRVHHWQCQKCGNLVKRAMNRRPQPADCRGFRGKGDACQDPYCLYHTHLRGCGGEYIKIKGPEMEGGAGPSKPKKPRKDKAGSAAAVGTSKGPGPPGILHTGGAMKQDGTGGGRHHVAVTPAGSGIQPITRFFHHTSPRDSSALGAAGTSSSAADCTPGPSGVGTTTAAPAAGASSSAGPDAVDDDIRRQRCLAAAMRRLGGANNMDDPDTTARVPAQHGVVTFQGGGGGSSGSGAAVPQPELPSSSKTAAHKSPAGDVKVISLIDDDDDDEEQEGAGSGQRRSGQHVPTAAGC